MFRSSRSYARRMAAGISRTESAKLDAVFKKQHEIAARKREAEKERKNK